VNHAPDHGTGEFAKRLGSSRGPSVGRHPRRLPTRSPRPATFNLIHPDAELRAAQTTQAVRLIGLIPELGADVVTLCSGTRNPDNMWRGHPGKPGQRRLDRPAAHTGRPARGRGRRRGSLGIEPEPGNVVRDARRATQLLGELGDDAPFGIVLDPANLLSPETVARQSEILAEAVDLLGTSVISIQAKDVVASGYSAADALTC
jgi:sugar phosphate isomerase/epimerase